jgi:cytochrome c oxidase subunit 1
MVALTVVNYGFPIAHLLATPDTAVPAVRIGERQ